MLKIFKNSFKKAVQTWQKYYIFSVSFKQNKKKLLLLIPEKKGDRVFIVHNTKLLTEYRGQGKKYFKN